MRVSGIYKKQKNRSKIVLTTVYPTIEKISSKTGTKNSIYPGVAQLGARVVWDCEIGNSSKIPYTSKKPLILRFFRFHIFCKYAIIGLRPHSVPQLRNFCKNPSIKLNISGCGAVGSARHLGCRCRRFEPCHSDQILTEF